MCKFCKFNDDSALLDLFYRFSPIELKGNPLLCTKSAEHIIKLLQEEKELYAKDIVELHPPIEFQYSKDGNVIRINDSTGCRFRIQGLNSKHVHKSSRGTRKYGLIDIQIAEPTSNKSEKKENPKYSELIKLLEYVKEGNKDKQKNKK